MAAVKSVIGLEKAHFQNCPETPAGLLIALPSDHSKEQVQKLVATEAHAVHPHSNKVTAKLATLGIGNAKDPCPHRLPPLPHETAVVCAKDPTEASAPLNDVNLRHGAKVKVAATTRVVKDVAKKAHGHHVPSSTASLPPRRQTRNGAPR